MTQVPLILNFLKKGAWPVYLYPSLKSVFRGLGDNKRYVKSPKP